MMITTILSLYWLKLIDASFNSFLQLVRSLSSLLNPDSNHPAVHFMCSNSSVVTVPVSTIGIETFTYAGWGC